MNKLINIVLSGLLWRRYKFLLVSLLLTILFMVIVGQVHQDYLGYNALLETPKYVGVSFALKWCVWILSVVLFLLLNNWYNNKKQAQKEQESGAGSNSALKKLLNRGAFTRNTKQTQSPQSVHEKSQKQPQPSSKADDPFAALRHKDKLRSYADVIIEKKKHDVS